jgi:hypothetical protein
MYSLTTPLWLKKLVNERSPKALNTPKLVVNARRFDSGISLMNAIPTDCAKKVSRKFALAKRIYLQLSSSFILINFYRIVETSNMEIQVRFPSLGIKKTKKNKLNMKHTGLIFGPY